MTNFAEHVCFLVCCVLLVLLPLLACVTCNHCVLCSLFLPIPPLFYNKALILVPLSIFPPGFNGLSLRTTSCLNWRRWWMTSAHQHLSKEVLRIPTWNPFRLKTWRRESWRLWRVTMGRWPAEMAHVCQWWRADKEVEARYNLTGSLCNSGSGQVSSRLAHLICFSFIYVLYNVITP